MATPPSFITTDDDDYIHLKKSDIAAPFNVTEDEIRQRVFDTITALLKDRNLTPDLRPPSLIYILTAPPIKELVLFYQDLGVTLSMGFLQTAVLQYLDAKGAELGIPRLQALPSKGIVRFLGDDPRIDDPTAQPNFIPPGTVVTTSATNPDDPVYQFEIDAIGSDDGTQAVDVDKMSIIATPDPNLIEGWGGPGPDEVFGTGDDPLPGSSIIADALDPGDPPTAITGSVMYEITYLTRMGVSLSDGDDNYEAGFGETAASAHSYILENLADNKVTITIPAVPLYTDLNEIWTVNVYRSLNDGGGFSDFKLVGTIDAFSTTLTFTDMIDNVNFDVIETTLEDINTTGVIELPATAVEASAGTNISARKIELLETTLDSISKVTNPDLFSLGTDDESDDAYRARLLLSLKEVPGAGTAQDYETWALTISSVEGATVIPEWEEIFGYPNGPGTVKVQVSGENSSQLNAGTVEEVRQYIAGDIAIESPYEYNDVANWVPNPADPTDEGPNKLKGTVIVDSGATGGGIPPGTYDYVYTYVNVGGGETPHNAVKPVQLVDAGPPPVYIGGDIDDSQILRDIVIAAPNNAVSLTNLSTGPSGVSVQNTVYRRIYRRLQGALNTDGTTDDKFYLVGVRFNTEDFNTIFTDNSPVEYARYAPVVNSTSLYNGQAPIGAHVTVESIDQFNVRIVATIVPDPGYTLIGTPGAANLRPSLDAAIATYFSTLAAGGRMYYTDLLNAIHDTVGVLDFYDVSVFAPGFPTMDGSTGSPRFIQADAGVRAVYNNSGSTFIEATS